MIGTSAVLQEDYNDNYTILDTPYFREQINEAVAGFIELKLFVTDSDTGRPISKAMVSIDTLGRTATCDVQGSVVLPDILSGSFVLDVIAPGYIANSSIVRVSVHQQERIMIQMIRNS